MNRIRRVLLLLIVFFTVVSCGDNQPQMEDSDILKLEDLLKKEPTKQHEVSLIGAIFRKGSEQKTAKEQELYFQYGVSTCEKLNYKSEKQSFITQLLKCCYRSEQTPERLATLAASLNEGGKKELATIINNSLWRNFRKSSEAKKVSVEDQKINIDDYIKSVGESAFDAAGSTGLKEKEAIQYIDMCEAIAMADPKNPGAASYLWKGAEMARTLGSIDKCLSLYTSLEEEFPGNEKSPDALFVKGYILETSYNDKTNAKIAYEKFLNNYPKHSLAKDAKFLLDNIDKTDDELLEMIPKEDQK